MHIGDCAQYGGGDSCSHWNDVLLTCRKYGEQQNVYNNQSKVRLVDHQGEVVAGGWDGEYCPDNGNPNGNGGNGGE